MNIYWVLWISMAWCFSTKASVPTVLSKQASVFTCLRVNSLPSMVFISDPAFF